MDEESNYLVKVKQAFHNVVLKHDEHDFEMEEQLFGWTMTFLSLTLIAKHYIEEVSAKNSENNGN